ncbi:DNA-binding response regulator, OmpR family, contains REC and winged-helix (wHTH) domain [Terrisporobacter glycolicus]|nr:DNA-binding response regulator, OmpR family, contains REC and winged-helix (wHTH) domain [Terrisporobacter glycolicus]
MNILVVEDEDAIRDLIEINLSMVGYNVYTACDGEEGKYIFDNKDIHLALLDVMVPKIDGFELIKFIKTKEIPVIFITAKDSVYDRVKGLRLGADDYIVKPFENIELIARIEAVSRRYQKKDSITNFQNISIDEDKRVVKKDGEIIDLTLKEYELLITFIQNKNIALSREQLLDKVWGFEYFGETRTVDIHVQRLRDKLKLKEYIKTVYKVGYRLQD